MKKRNPIIALCKLFCLVVAFALSMLPKLRGEKPKEVSSPAIEQTLSPSIPFVPTQTDGKVATKARTFEQLMQTPIEFYGVVLDQDGKPIASATVSGSVSDSWKGSPISVTTGIDGKFTIISKGTALYLKATKPGYYRVRKGGHLRPSEQGFDFGNQESPQAYQPDPNSPTIFHLRKAVNATTLDLLTANPNVPSDGTPITVTLSKKSAVSLQIFCRTNQENVLPNVPFDWRCEINIAGGGIQEAASEHIFVAPDGGYLPSAVIDMPKTLDAKQWNSRVNKIYWLRFPDNTFGKISFRMQASGHFAVINCFRNPTPNDRSIEPNLDDQ